MVKIDNSKYCLFNEYFSKLSDPRQENKVLYPLDEILLITVCAVIGGADNWVEIEEFGEAKKDFFKQLVPLKNGIPSHDTFGDIFSVINPEKFRDCFVEWVKSIQTRIKDIVSIDGKCLRRSGKKGDTKSAIHIVSAWANKQRLVLGQEKVSEKSNEITAIPKLLELLDLTGSVVTIDAMGCQKEIAKKIVSKNADYVLALKGNQGEFHEDVKFFVDDERKSAFTDVKFSFHETANKGHGRIETRRYGVTEDIAWLLERHNWSGLTSIGFVEARRKTGDKISVETRYYISSMKADAVQFAEAVRGHWGVENSLHWVMDVNFKDDLCRIRKENAPHNFAIIKHMANNLIRKEASTKKSMNVKRRVAGWSNDYLMKVITQ